MKDQPNGPDPLDIELGHRIRKRRLQTRMTQERLAAALGVTFQQVQKYESGRNRISFSRLVAVARALGCSLAELSDGVAEQADRTDEWANMIGVEGAYEALQAYCSIGSGKLRQAMIEHMRRLGEAAPAEAPKQRMGLAHGAVR